MTHSTRALPFLVLLACTPAQGPIGSIGRGARPIIGGVTTTGDPGVVLLRESQQGGYSLCTGEVVSPHVIMTAAHCVLGGGQFDIFFGSDMNGPEGQDPSKWITVQETHYNPNFSEQQLGNGQDVAVAILASPTAVKPLPMNRAPISDAMVGQMMLRIVGYGLDNGNDQSGQSAGVKREASTALTGYDDNFIQFGDAQKDTCQGDSGGPAFLTVGGVEAIAGVTSFGAVGCTGGATDTRVDTVGVAFVDPYIQQFDPAQNNVTPDLAETPVVDLAQPPAPPDMATSGNGNGNGGGGNGNGGGNGSGSGQPGHGVIDLGHSSSGCTLAGRAAATPAWLLFLVAAALVSWRRGRARY